MATKQQAAMQPPPRLTGDYASDFFILSNWMQSFYSVGVLQTGLIDPSFQSTAGDPIDPNNLPDPAETTIARSQLTGNTALTQAIAANGAATGLGTRMDDAEAELQGHDLEITALQGDVVTVNNRAVQALADAAAAEADAQAALAGLPILVATFTLNNANNAATIGISPALPDTNYLVMVGNQDFTGTPPLDALVLARVAKTTTTFTVTFGAAPGSGNSVTYTAILFPTG